jgi:phosphatidylethanolamine-binding protein (PEBP) family uncharacterized protein
MSGYRFSVVAFAGHLLRVAALVTLGLAGVAACGSTVSAPGDLPGRPGATVGPAVGATPGSAPATAFTVSSPVMAEGEALPVEFTCDGAARTPALAWSGAPEGTVGYAVVMHTEPGPGDTHWYWVLYDIAPTIDHLETDSTPPAEVGTNSVNGRIGYAPPCSKGPGPKVYTFTVYALSGRPDLPGPAAVSRPVLLGALDGLILAEARLNVTYTRR